MTTDTAGTPGQDVGPDDLRTRALAGVFWTATEKWLVRLSTFVGFVILGRLLAPEQFGTVALAMAFISVLGIVTDAGFATYLVQLRDLTARVVNTAFYIALVLGLVLAGGLAALSGPISRALDAPALREVLLALAVTLVIAGSSSVPAALLQRQMRFRELAMRQVTATLLSVVVAVTLAFAGAGVWALVAQHLVRTTVAAVALWSFTEFRPRLSFSGSDARRMLGFGSKSMGVQLGSELRDQGEVFLIGALAGPTALGLWTVAGRLVEAIAGLTTSAFGRVSEPVFARLQDDRPRLARVLGKSMAGGGLVLVPVLVGLALTSGDVVPALFGSQWAPAAGIASLLALRGLASGLSAFHRSALMATGHPGAELSLTLGLLVVQLVLVLTLAGGDLMTLAAALAVWMVLGWPVRAVVVRRLVGVPWGTYRGLGVVVLAGALAAGAVLGADARFDLDGWAHHATVAGVGSAVYLGTVVLLDRALPLEVLGVVTSRLRHRRRTSL